MSTDHYNIDGPRSSSRVLRPPGGSYTDILGVKAGPNDAVKTVKSTPKGGIADCFKFEDSPPTQPEAKKEEETKENEKIQTCENGNENNNPKDNESSAEKNQSSAPQKVRVPPGGWSSGLW